MNKFISSLILSIALLILGTRAAEAAWIYYPVDINYTVNPSQADLTASGVSPASAAPNTPVSLSATITNAGASATPAGFVTLFQRATDAMGTGATDIGTFTRATSLASAANFAATLSYTFTSTGTWYIRACADKSSAADLGTVAESDEGNNCSSAWTAVAVGNAPNVTLSASPNPVTSSGATTTLTWTVTGNPTSCTASDGWSGSKSISGGSQASPAVVTTTIFTITCTGPGGTDADSVTVTINTPAAPTASLSANPTSVLSGGSSFLTWACGSSATSCVGSGFNTGGANSGMIAVTPSATTTYSVTASNAGGSNTADATVTVNGTGPGGACSNSIDDDGDGKIDFGQDPGCTSASDGDETDPKPIFIEF